MCKTFARSSFCVLSLSVILWGSVQVAHGQATLLCERIDGNTSAVMSLHGFLADVSGYPVYEQNDYDFDPGVTSSQTGGALSLEVNDSSVSGSGSNLAMAPCPLNASTTLPQVASGDGGIFTAETGLTETMFPYDTTEVSFASSAAGQFEVLDGPGTETDVYVTVSMSIAALFVGPVTNAADSSTVWARFDNVEARAHLGNDGFGPTLTVSVDGNTVYENWGATGMYVQFMQTSGVGRVHEIVSDSTTAKGFNLSSGEGEASTQNANGSVAFEVEDWTGVAGNPDLEEGYLYIFDEEDGDLLERVDVGGGMMEMME